MSKKCCHSGVQHNGRVAAFGPWDLGSNPLEDWYSIKFKLIIYTYYKSTIVLKSVCDPAIGSSLVGIDKQIHKMQCKNWRQSTEVHKAQWITWIAEDQVAQFLLLDVITGWFKAQYRGGTSED